MLNERKYTAIIKALIVAYQNTTKIIYFLRKKIIFSRIIRIAWYRDFLLYFLDCFVCNKKKVEKTRILVVKKVWTFALIACYLGDAKTIQYHRLFFRGEDSRFIVSIAISCDIFIAE
jgi:hypothetical protein